MKKVLQNVFSMLRAILLEIRFLLAGEDWKVLCRVEEALAQQESSIGHHALREVYASALAHINCMSDVWSDWWRHMDKTDLEKIVCEDNIFYSTVLGKRGMAVGHQSSGLADMAAKFNPEKWPDPKKLHALKTCIALWILNAQARCSAPFKQSVREFNPA